MGIWEREGGWKEGEEEKEREGGREGDGGVKKPVKNAVAEQSSREEGIWESWRDLESKHSSRTKWRHSYRHHTRDRRVSQPGLLPVANSRSSVYGVQAVSRFFVFCFFYLICQGIFYG